MAINLAQKYEKKVLERFKNGSKTDSGAGHDYDFNGVDTITIYQIDTVPLVDYTRSGTARFGQLTELGDTKQSLVIAKDRAFTFSIDKGNAVQQFNIKQANACLKREIDEVVTPEIDKYRLQSWADGKGLSAGRSVLSATDGALTKANILEKIFEANATMSDNDVPDEGRIIYLPELTFVKFRLADVVMGADGIAAENIRRGYRGTIDSLQVVTVPSSRFPTGVNFIIKKKNATIDPVQLTTYRVQKEPMGVNGDVVEGRVIYDSFCLDGREKAIFVSRVSAASGT